jgi:hypothetical protein
MTRVDQDDGEEAFENIRLVAMEENAVKGCFA